MKFNNVTRSNKTQSYEKNYLFFKKELFELIILNKPSFFLFKIVSER